MGVASPTVFGCNSSYRHVSTRFDAQYGAFWCFIDSSPRFCFTPELMEELIRFQQDFERTAREAANGGDPPIRYFIAASGNPGVFNLGGDLSLFARCVVDRDAESLRKYARTCIAALYPYIAGFHLPITTISLVQGDALGGGFETALGGDILVAERSAQMGFPEVLFNLFPGMGAYHLLLHRVGVQRTERMLLNGKLYSAEELHAEGVVDRVAEDGQGENAVYDFIIRNESRRHARESVRRVRRLLSPVRYEDLQRVADIWVETAMRLGPREVRLMERVARSQGRLYRRVPESLHPSLPE
ncbi:MAG TPA: crotonase/enoyl-CoA hydratase family protein [Candidatus Deferrimicrobiaceae bacterium]